MLKILFSKEEIESQVRHLASLINRDFQNEKIIFVCVLKGSFVFTSDLVRHVSNQCCIEFVRVSSYGNAMASSGAIRILKDLETSIEGQNVVIVEDIIDSGLTLCYLREMLAKRKPKSLKICALVDKRSLRKVEIEGDYVGFSIDNGFIVGYGIDYAEDYRNLPEIYVVENQ